MIPLAKIARGSALLFFLLATLGSGTASAADAQVPSKGAAFGDKPSFQSSDLSYAASPDKQSFTITVNPAPEASAAMHVDNIDGELGPTQKPGKKQ
jgi:hypothetical protein